MIVPSPSLNCAYCHVYNNSTLLAYNDGTDVRFASELGQIDPKWENLGLFKISVSTFWRTAPKCTDTDLKKSQIFPFGVNLALFISNPDTPARRLCLYGAKCDVTRDAGS